MALLDVFQEDQDQEAQKRLGQQAQQLLGRLVQADQYVGDVYALGYEYASVQIHDFHRQKVGGIPSLCFLVATRIVPDEVTLDYRQEDTSVILLRVMDATALPGDADAERVRVELAQKVAGEVKVNWDDQQHMDATTHNLLSFAGVKCRVIGTFYVDHSARHKKLVLRFGSDISNYYPNRGLKVYKPNQKALETIANYVDPDRLEDRTTHHVVQIGTIRYASTHRAFQGVDDVQVTLSPIDLFGQKSALFGMTRTGKSNTTKIIVQAVFNLRFGQGLRIGQLVFDPNGEYANENSQDANQQQNPSAIKNVWRVQGGDPADVVTYGILPHPNDPNRRLMLLNFLDEDSLQIGKEILDTALAEDHTKFIQNFRQVRFVPPDAQDRSATTRYQRVVLVYRALLAQAGFTPTPSLQPITKGLFNTQLLEAMEKSQSPDAQRYGMAATILRSGNCSWNQLATVCTILIDFIEDNKSGYGSFEDAYMKRTGGSGDAWADETLKKVLVMFKYPNGVKQLGKVVSQHSQSITSDYAQDIYEDLVAGRLVIIDQSSGDPDLNQSSAERIMWRVFRAQQALFRQGVTDIPELLVYIEEAHNLLPTGTEQDMTNVWVRTAKEGAKYHIGMVYSTQEVSSVQRNILKNTANWFIGHLNNADETRELCKYYDFADFESSIRRTQDRGFLRIKTLSNLFVIPVQVRKFEV